MRATRAAVGEEFVIMADLNQWWRMAGDTSPALDRSSVLRIAAELADLGVFWLEEPLPGDDLAGMRALRAHVRVAGEFPYDPPGWTPERRDFFLTEPIRIDPDGYLTVPDAPGLGAKIDHPAVARYARTT